MNDKIQKSHLQKPAYIYLRQSSINQVRHNQESTERQYALRDKAIGLGWPTHMIHILDGDLGLSGTQSATRQDFQNLVALVSIRKVGAVFAIEASRLSRSCTDWHRLVELCAFTETLIIDEDGYYNPSDFNDQLLLGLKGTMSQAELHFLRARLQGGKLNKDKRFTRSMIRWIRYKQGIPVPILKQPDEMTVNQVMAKFSVSRWVVYYWIERKVISARRLNNGSPYWITIDPQKAHALSTLIKNSTKIQKQLNQHSKTL